MKLSEKEVLHVARLARLKVNQDETAGLIKDLSSILDYMDILGDIDTSRIEPTIHVHSRVNALRQDALTGSLEIKEALVNAPCVHGNAFEVPMVISEE